jgi:hypothetical protein
MKPVAHFWFHLFTHESKTLRPVVESFLLLIRELCVMLPQNGPWSFFTMLIIIYNKHNLCFFCFLFPSSSPPLALQSLQDRCTLQDQFIGVSFLSYFCPASNTHLGGFIVYEFHSFTTRVFNSFSGVKFLSRIF